MAYVLAVTNQKGGVGKTTTTVNLAAQLAASHRRVVIVDLDPQGNSSSSLGVDKDQLDRTLYDTLIGDAKASDIVQQTSTKNLYILPANASLAQAEVDLVALERREMRLKSVLSLIDADVVIIDCPPALGLLTINGLAAADGVIIPVQAEYFALEGLSQLMQTLQLVRQGINPGLKIFGIVLTMYTKRMVLSEQVKQEIADCHTEKYSTRRSAELRQDYF